MSQSSNKISLKIDRFNHTPSIQEDLNLWSFKLFTQLSF